ncbi:MAG: bifunctional DNA primase/polymerase [Thermoanaerobaculia bacterium]|nr:bifunctional DNA primase/polymerase [Thermoanaerobaculia bacterium]
MRAARGSSRDNSAASDKLAQAALGYAESGYEVLPLVGRGKRPLTRHGVKDATTNVDQIRSWWARRPRANIGLAVPPGYLVLDLDNSEALHRLRAQDLSLPTTATAATGRGQHLWYATGETLVRNRASLFPDVDIRAPGGYVVAPPSIHPNGGAYRWIVPLEPDAVTECPEWLLDLLDENRSSSFAPKPQQRQSLAAQVPQGRRNDTLARVAGFLFRRLPAAEAAELAYCWAQVKLRPPLPEAEILRTINSIAGCELRRQEERE